MLTPTSTCTPPCALTREDVHSMLIMYIEGVMKTSKHLNLDQERINEARRILNACTETDTIHQALDRVIEMAKTQSRRRRVSRAILQLREEIGTIPEPVSQWIRWAREERTAKP